MQSPAYARSRSPLDWKKPLLFGLWAALGALLCALLGEVWLAYTLAPPPPPPPPPPAAPPQAIVMVLDTSGSMDGQPFEEMKQAAQDFIARQDFKRTRVGIVSFNSESRVIASLSRDPVALSRSIDTLSVDGLTRMDLGLGSAISLLPAATAPGVTSGTKQQEEVEKRSILLFTDGYPGDFNPFVNAVDLTRSVATSIRQGGCRLVAIGSEGSDQDFLGELTGDPRLVFAATDGQFGEAFKLAQNAINSPTGRALIQSQKIDNFDAGLEMWRIAVWTGLLGLGVSSALILSQGVYARRRPTALDAAGILAGLAAGCIAGGLGQWLFSQAGDARFVVTMSRLLAWATCGALIGAGISLFIPNLATYRAALGGTLGGWLGAMGFIILAHNASDMVGRVLGAAIIGFAIGLMVVLAEVAFRSAWLHVSYGPKDAFDLSLGAQAVAVGSDRTQCRIFAKETPAVAATYFFEAGQAVLKEPNGSRHNLHLGDKRRFGNVEITLLGDEKMASVMEQTPIAPNGLISQTPSPIPLAPIPLAQSAPSLATNALPAQPAGWVLRGEQVLVLPTSSPVSIGRTAGNDLVIADAGVSSSHARITVGGTLLTITDLGSTNGTFVNGKRLETGMATPLRVGNSLRVGKLDFTIERA